MTVADIVPFDGNLPPTKPAAEMAAPGFPDQCCFGLLNGVRCKRRGYWETLNSGKPTGLKWCSKHRPRSTDDVTGLKHLGGAEA